MIEAVCEEEILTTFDWLQATALKVHLCEGCGGFSGQLIDT